MPRQVILFSAPDCPDCEQARNFFNEQGLPFVERDISTDETANLELRQKGYRGATPVVVIDDQVMIGFDADKLKQMLQQAA